MPRIDTEVASTPLGNPIACSFLGYQWAQTMYQSTLGGRCIIYGALLATLVGCTRTVDPIALPRAVQLVISTNFQRARHCSIVQGSERYEELDTWLRAHRSGWRSSVATYMQGIEISANDFKLGFQADLAVLNSPRGQFIHPVTAGEYAFLTCPSP